MRRFHPDKVADEKLECQLCHVKFKRRDNLTHHKRVCEYRTTGKRVATNQIGGSAPKRHRNTRAKWSEQALQHTTDKFIINFDESQQTPETVIDIFKNSLMDFRPTIEEELESKRAMKIVVALHASFHQATDPTFLTEPHPVFNSLPIEILPATDIDEALQEVFKSLMKKIDEYMSRGSCWILHELLRLDLHTYEYIPLQGSTYIPLPKDLKAKHAVINMNNTDEKCFIWCIALALYGDPNAPHQERVTHLRQHEHKFNMTGIEMPMQLKDIPRFERQNDISVSVYGWENARINKDGVKELGYATTLRIAKDIKPRHVNLLMIGDEVKHYCWIKHFSRLVRSQYTGARIEHAYCRFCLHGFYGKAIPGQCTRLEDAKRRRDEHEKECFRHGGQKTSFPEEPFVEFKAIQKQVVTLFNFFHFRTNR